MSVQKLEELKSQLFQNLRYRLGEGIIDLEIDNNHMESAYQYALKVYRCRIIYINDTRNVCGHLHIT
jgi:hypothetical protein